MTAKQKFYSDVDANPDFPALERDILAFWKQDNTFKQSIEQRNDHHEYVFYDGPPFANGLPHYGHLLTGYVKDLFARYHTMKGERVERRFGWDCHGMPAEMGAEKELGVSGRVAIEKFGIQKFNDYCRSSVMRYTGEWESYVTRQARWVDFQNDYKTMNKDYMESVIWAFKQLYDKGLVYESHRVMPYSWAMETPVSNFETRMDNSYREREDKAITVAFKLKDKPAALKDVTEDVYLLAWTTTPWTLPSNLALAVSDKLNYSANYVVDKKHWIITNNLDGSMPAGEGENLVPSILMSGADLINLSYEPLFPYFKETANAFRVLDGSDFIEEGSGTGVVHMAPGFGEDDQRVCAANGIGMLCPVNERGQYTDAVYDIEGLSLKGLNVVADTNKGEDDPYNEGQLQKYGLANLRIISYLKKSGQLIKEEQYKHSYPHCWRTDTPLIYRAVPSWYVEVSKFAPRMVELNQQINWIPSHIKDGRFGKWLENAHDWSISRNRYWGSPIPVWRNDKDSEIRVFGSIAELKDFFGTEVQDLHRPFIDELVKTDAQGRTWKRVTDVFDCWFESGSMPYAQVHYPFENKDWFESHFPADFIVEYEAQTRGWFYTLMVLSTALFDKPPFKNCICHGVVLDDKGQKLSKRLNNYADPQELFEQYGSDALRWFMMASPVMRGSELYIDKEGKFIRDAVRLYIKPIWNAYNFFVLYANADGVKAQLDFTSDNGMDRYILSKLATSVRGVEAALDAYDTPSACQAVTVLFEDLNNWYIRRNKERFWKKEQDADKQAAYNTLYTVLHVMCRAVSPLLPLLSEVIYKGLTGEESVHLADFPQMDYAEDVKLMETMDFVRDACNAALAVRNKSNIRVRQPLAQVKLAGARAAGMNDYFAALIQDEINVKAIGTAENIAEFAELKMQVNLPKVGKTLGPKIKDVMAAAKNGEWVKNADNTLTLAGITLQEGEYNIMLEPKASYKDAAQALSSNDALVILDLSITPELEQEGIARDVVRMIQQARKDADLDVSAYIALSLQAPEKLAKAMETHKNYIAEQTLAASLTIGAMGNVTHRFENTLEDETIVVGFTLAKAAA